MYSVLVMQLHGAVPPWERACPRAGAGQKMRPTPVKAHPARNTRATTVTARTRRQVVSRRPTVTSRAARFDSSTPAGSVQATVQAPAGLLNPCSIRR